MSTPIITIFVRHGFKNGKPCKYAGDEFSRRCNCRKHFRWTHNGTQFRRQAGTRSWEQAEEIKRQLQDQLAGRSTEARPEDNVRSVSEAVDLFIKDKKIQGVTPGVIKKYTLELERLSQYCERKSVYTVQGISRELLTDLCTTWETYYPSSYTRAKVRERCRSFLRYCYECKWLERIPPLPKITIDDRLPCRSTLMNTSGSGRNPRSQSSTWDGKMSSQTLTANTGSTHPRTVSAYALEWTCHS